MAVAFAVTVSAVAVAFATVTVTVITVSSYLIMMLLLFSCRPGVACSASGVGEVIMRACLAKECCQRMLNQTLSVDEACSQVMQETNMQVLRRKCIWFAAPAADEGHSMVISETAGRTYAVRPDNSSLFTQNQPRVVCSSTQIAMYWFKARFTAGMH